MDASASILKFNKEAVRYFICLFEGKLEIHSAAVEENDLIYADTMRCLCEKYIEILNNARNGCEESKFIVETETRRLKRDAFQLRLEIIHLFDTYSDVCPEEFDPYINIEIDDLKEVK